MKIAFVYIYFIRKWMNVLLVGWMLRWLSCAFNLRRFSTTNGFCVYVTLTQIRTKTPNTFLSAFLVHLSTYRLQLYVKRLALSRIKVQRIVSLVLRAEMQLGVYFYLLFSLIYLKLWNFAWCNKIVLGYARCSLAFAQRW